MATIQIKRGTPTISDGSTTMNYGEVGIAKDFFYYGNSSNKAVQVATSRYVHSRGENLLTNGFALLGNNTNFSSFTFDGSQAYFSGGSFRYKRPDNGGETAFTDEFIPVDVNKTYRLNMVARTLNGAGRYYAMIPCYDVDNLPVNSTNHMYKANTLTTLATTLVPGATIVQLTNATNWENGGTAGVSTHLRSFIFWNYTNSFGYLYPPLTYSRNWYGNMWNPGGINFGTNTITLITPWAGPTIPAGTQLSNGSAGGTYKYLALVNTIIPTTWTEYTGTMEGVDLTGTNASFKFPPGTAKVKIGWLMNYEGTGETAWFSSLSFGLDYSLATLNGSRSTLPVFFAPTTVGTNGHFLKSGGSGAPSWSALAAAEITTALGYTPLSITGGTLSNKLTITSATGGDGSFVNSGLWITNSSTTTGEVATVYQNSGAAGTGSNFWMTGLNQGPNYAISYGNTFADANAKMVVLTDGKVGIGNISPAARLTIHDSASATTYLQLTNNATGVALTDGLNILQNGLNSVFINREDGYMSFETNNTEKVRILSDGKVGIGTTTPYRQFHVSGAAATLRVGPYYTSGGDRDYVDILAGGTDSTIQTANDGLFKIWNLDTLTGGIALGTNNTERFRILVGGNVGIGTSTPAYKFDVAGDINISTGSKFKINGVDLAASDVGAAPTSHATTSATYGAASATNYGHLRWVYPGSTLSGALVYGGTTVTVSAGMLYSSTIVPSDTIDLKYNGYFYATQLYEGSTRVSTTGHTHAYSLVNLNGTAATNSTASFYAPTSTASVANALLLGSTNGAPVWSSTAVGTAAYQASTAFVPAYAAIISTTATSLTNVGSSYNNSVVFLSSTSTVDVTTVTSSAGTQITFMKTGASGTINFISGSSQTLNGSTTTKTLTTQYKAVTLICSAPNTWFGVGF